MQVNAGYISENTPHMSTYTTSNSNTPKFDTESLTKKNETVEEDNAVTDYDEKAFYLVGSNAPEDVKKAWMEAAKEVGSNGLGMLQNGMMGHISQMMVQRVVAWYNGETDCSDILGSTVESAIQAAEQALYNLDNPLEPNVSKSIEVQHLRMQEREFYTIFLDKLREL